MKLKLIRGFLFFFGLACIGAWFENGVIGDNLSGVFVLIGVFLLLIATCGRWSTKP